MVFDYDLPLAMAESKVFFTFEDIIDEELPSSMESIPCGQRYPVSPLTPPSAGSV